MSFSHPADPTRGARPPPPVMHAPTWIDVAADRRRAEIAAAQAERLQAAEQQRQAALRVEAAEGTLGQNQCVLQRAVRDGLVWHQGPVYRITPHGVGFVRSRPISGCGRVESP